MYGTNLANASNFAFAFLHKILTSEAKGILRTATLSKIRLAQVFSWEIWEISKNTFSYRISPVAASVACWSRTNLWSCLTPKKFSQRLPLKTQRQMFDFWYWCVPFVEVTVQNFKVLFLIETDLILSCDKLWQWNKQTVVEHYRLLHAFIYKQHFYKQRQAEIDKESSKC